jgi:hypothetical protein
MVRPLDPAPGGSVRALRAGDGMGAPLVVAPPARGAGPAVVRTPRLPSAAEHTPEGTEPPRLDGLRLLIVDDEADALSLVT